MRNCVVKRIFDIVLAFIGLTLLFPVLLVVSALIYVKLGSPILFTQVRPGFKGKPFRMIKFRTMKDAVDKNGFPLPDAERVTAFGLFLRSTSLDELPELWNVLKGEMSLVGPRPEVPRYVELYDKYQEQILLVQPGITDYASIEYRNENYILGKSNNPE